MAVAKAVVSSVQRKSGGIAIFTGGSQSTSGNSQVTEMVTHASSAYRQGSKNGLPVVSATKGNSKGLVAGSFGFFDKTKWVMLANAVTVTLSGVANTVLKSGAAHFFKKPFNRKTTYKTHFTSGIQWEANSIDGPTYTITKSNQTTTYSDDASVFSASEPGELIYMNGSKNPIMGGYQGMKLW